MSPRRRVGFSMAEIIVFTFLLLMLTTGMYLLLVAGLRTVQQTQAYQTAQQQATTGIRKLVGELSDARADNDFLLYSPGSSNGVRFLSANIPLPASSSHMVHDGTSGAVIWQKWVGYYLNGQNLMRVEAPGSGTPCAACTAVGIPNCLNAQFDPSAPLPVLTIPAVPTGASGGGAWAIPASRKGTKVVARNITVLDFEPPNAAPVGVMGLAVTLYAQDATASDKVTQVRYQITAWLQN